MPKELSDIPHGLRRVYRRFQHWRNKHPQARLPIPKRLWLAGAKAARENGEPQELLVPVPAVLGYRWRSYGTCS